MRRASCKEVEASIAAYTSSELGDDERAAIAVHLDVCDDCRELAEVWRALPRVAREAQLEPMSEQSERYLLSAEPEELQPRRPGTPSRAPAAVGLALAAGVMLVLGTVLWLVFSGGPAPDTGGPHGQAANEGTGSSGEDADRTQLALDEQGRRVIALGFGERLVLSDSARVRLLETSADATVCRATLEAGHVDVKLDSVERTDDLVIETPAGAVSAREALFSLEVAGDHTVELRVLEGVVYKRAADGEIAQALNAGQRATLAESPRAGSDAKPPAKVAAQPGFESGLATAGATLDGLLKQAREHRKRRDFERAAAAYERLIKTFPGSATAKSSLVALGQMELGSMGHPAEALAHFEAYLKASPNGVLAEEARAGRVRAQARLGRARELVRDATSYLRSHSDGRSASEMLRRRADAHRRLGACADAVRDYRRVLERWPGSTEAELAAKGLDACSAAP